MILDIEKMRKSHQTFRKHESERCTNIDEHSAYSPPIVVAVSILLLKQRGKYV